MSDYWTDAELARFDYFELDGAKSPGVLFEMELGDGTPLKWDSQNGFGLSGEFTRFTGLGLAEFKFKLRLVDDTDRAAFDGAAWRKASKPPVQGQPDRYRAIKHPILERHPVPIKFVTMLTVPFEQPGTTEGGGAIVTYSFKAHRKQLPQPVTPKAPEAATGSVPENAYQTQIAALTKRIDAELASGAPAT